MDVPENLFMRWLFEYSKKRGAPSIGEEDGVPRGFYIPSSLILNKLYANLGLTSNDILRVSRDTRIVNAFCYFWRSTYFHGNGIQAFRDKLITPDGKTIKILTNAKVDHPKFSSIQIEGFLSLPHLTSILKASGNSPNVDNPFRRYLLNRDMLLPDASILADLYAHFGVSGFEELFPTKADFDQIFKSHEINPTILLRIELPNEEPINILQIIGETYFLERLPNSYMNKIAAMIENRKGAKGDIKLVSKDVFGLIASGHLKGKDLFSLCLSSPEVNRTCNKDDYALFKRALKSEFRVDFKAGMSGFQNARDLYFQAYQIHWHLQYDGNKLIDAKYDGLYRKNPTEDKVIHIPSLEFSQAFNLGGSPPIFISPRDDPSLVFAAMLRNGVITVSNYAFADHTGNFPYMLLLAGTSGYTRSPVPGMIELGFETGVVDFYAT